MTNKPKKKTKKPAKKTKKTSDKTKLGRHHYKRFEYDGRTIAIDTELATLLPNMWQLGIRTAGCCQAECCYSCKHDWTETKQKDGTTLCTHPPTDHCKDHVWIIFEAIRDYEQFLNAVAVYEPYPEEEKASPTMYELVCSTQKCGKSHYYTGNNDRWEVHFRPENDGVAGHWKRHTRNGKRDGFAMWSEDTCTKNDFRIQANLHFPRKHLSYVEKRIQLAVDAQ